MSAIEDKLKKLQTDLEKIDKEIADAKGTLDNTQKAISKKNDERNELNAQIAPLKKQADELSGSRSADRKSVV
jgi:peptidoglycan hydrolase CwlO-like protein